MKIKPERNFATLLSLLTLLILICYIIFREGTIFPIGARNSMIKGMSDEGDMSPQYEDVDLLNPIPAVSFEVPKEISFAGSPVPLSIPDVHERLDKELQINCYLHSNTIILIKRANRWLPQMEPILKKYGIPDDFKYLPLVESNLLNASSPKAAVGYWQILEDSGEELGLEITKQVDERYDPLKSTEAACKYLRKAYDRLGDWALVAASYNRGVAGVKKAMENQKVDNYYDLYLNDETSRYVFRIIAIREIIEHPKKYGFNVSQLHLYEAEKLRYVEVNEDIKDLVAFARSHGSNYKLLKRHNPWLQDEKLLVKKGKTYRIALPE
jgi:membrane-bound lytic murein transglycosylase D